MKKVLLVSQLGSALEEEKKILSDRNLMLFTARSSEDAIAILRGETVDLIITDIDMPGTSGDTFISIIRKDKVLGKIPIFITCNNKKSDIERCASWGTDSYITKPLDPALFFEKVSQLISVPKRSGVRVLTKISVKGTFKNEKFFCNSVDISASGILIESDRVISKGDTITCSLFVPGSSNHIVVDCVVRRVVKISSDIYHYGAKFLSLNPEDKLAIEKFVRKKTS